MNNKALGWAIDKIKQHDLTIAVGMTLRIIAGAANSKGKSELPIAEITLIYEALNLGRIPTTRSIQRHIKVLRDLGIIERSEQHTWKETVVTTLVGYK